MKMTKKIFLGAVAVAAFALVGCGMGNLGELNTKQVGTKKNLTVSVTGAEDEGLLFQRGWKQLGSKETVQSIETVITIDTSKVTSKVDKTDKTDDDGNTIYKVAENGTIPLSSVIGLIFDLHESEITTTVDGKDVKSKVYDFVIVGYRPSDYGFYVEKYENIAEDAFEAATNKSGFGTPTTYITATSSTAFVYNNDNGTDSTPTWVKTTGITLEKDDDDNEFNLDNYQQITVTITQETAGTYKIAVGGEEYTYTPEENDDYKNKDGYRIGGAGYYVNAPLGTAIKANFNSKNDTTVGLMADEE